MVTPFALALISSTQLMYSGSAKGPLDQFYFTVHEPGAKVGIASDRARLRTEPNTTGKVLAELPLGQQVTVVSKQEARTKIDERVDHWYQVEVPGPKPVRGWIFGATLSTAVFELDFDGDGEQENVSVSWTWNFKLKVRVVEPGLEPGKREIAIELDPFGQAYACCGGNATVSVVPAATAGIALLEVATSVEACGDFGTSWVSYTAAARKTVGRPQLALSIAGLADPPSHSTFAVRFDAKTRVATVERESWADSEEGDEKVDLSKETERHVLTAGVFKEKK